MEDIVYTVGRAARTKIAVGACRFICTVFPCQQEKTARKKIQIVKKEFQDATHNAFAFIVGQDDLQIRRSDDDREPAGTAGPPMLAVLEKNELINVLIVGTRYFGGVKLGIGGLIRAYRSCAEAGIKEAGIIRKIAHQEVSVKIPYNYLGAVLNEIQSLEGEIIKIEYSQQVTVRFRLRKPQFSIFKLHLSDITQGNAKVLKSHLAY